MKKQADSKPRPLRDVTDMSEMSPEPAESWRGGHSTAGKFGQRALPQWMAISEHSREPQATPSR